MKAIELSKYWTNVKNQCTGSSFADVDIIIICKSTAFNFESIRRNGASLAL